MMRARDMKGNAAETLAQAGHHSLDMNRGLGLVEWFRPGEYLRVRQLLDELRQLGVSHLRSGFILEDWNKPENAEWFAWLMPTLASRVDVLPCLCWSRPTLERQAVKSESSCDPENFAAFVQDFLERFGKHLQWVEVGNPMDDRCSFDWKSEGAWEEFAARVGPALSIVRAHGKRSVIGGFAPADPMHTLGLCGSGVLEQVDALGLSGYPGSWDFNWQRWPVMLRRVRRLLRQQGYAPQLWITATGYSTWRHDQVLQARKLVEALRAPADRVYWLNADRDRLRQKKQPEEFGSRSLRQDERCYHLGLKTADGRPKFALRLWRERGLAGLAALTDTLLGEEPHPGEVLLRSIQNPLRHKQENIGLAVRAQQGFSGGGSHKPVLITGGAGFVGSNLAWRLAEQGREVVILDCLSRPGVERNVEALLDRFGRQIHLKTVDIRDFPTVRKLVREASETYHFAAQVAVTTSLEAPREDFEVNLTGTLNILESMREMQNPPPLLFTSTNKVYGALDDVPLEEADGRYRPQSEAFRNGISEQQALDFHSPYGCSKGAADQYVLDYARSYNLPAAVFRMSCIYGPHQFGTEDQGWVAHFLIQIMKGKSITLYGDGRQVRDLLFVEDLIDAMLLAQQKMPELRGRAFNMGGGPANSTSLLEVISHIETLTGRKCDYRFADWRLGDQRYYVSDTGLFQQLTGWRARTDIQSGLRRLHQWLTDNIREEQSELDLSARPQLNHDNEASIQPHLHR